MSARSVYFTGDGEVEVREREVDDPGEGEVRVRAERSAVSPGTELLVYRGEVPTGMAADATIDALSEEFEFPLRYGYAVVGRVTATGPDVDASWADRRVLAFNPHESRFCASVDDVVAVPDDCSAAAATFLPNVETAVNLVQDGAPRLGERAAVFGQGVVGLLTTALLADCPLAALATVDRHPARRERSLELGADAALDPAGAAEVDADVGDRLRERLGDEFAGADLTYELSGAPEALDDAVAATGYDGRVVVGSWYGTKPAELDLGGRFHRSRISIESSQVSTIDPALRGRWSKDRRLAVAWDRLRDLDPERFVTHEFDVGAADEAYALLDENPGEALGVTFRY
ncbi:MULTISPECIES: zinc-binding alcohol dehydrogenase [Halorussus]|uniref:zinc-binding dehydrogenase n=1 Tax=Halorussus TaxID=1070314 RepID=UPI000E20F40E|nr:MULTISPECIES: zinc-binding alcohol dehydrogenase [Halorussus]NHN57608.1 zinc-binding dehydrogenase [Halorussus sp. JP-T4]